jgi:hypothetical protein
MLPRLLYAIDDFLIDRIFQSACDKIRRVFGWTKEAPMGISLMTTAICYIPMCASNLDEEPTRPIGWMMAAWIIWCSWLALRLIQKGVSGKDSIGSPGSAVMDIARILMAGPRIASLLIVILMVPILLWMISIPEMSLVSSFFLVGLLSNIGVIYFQACTDLPPGKTVLARMRERIAEWFARPVMARKESLCRVRS